MFQSVWQCVPTMVNYLELGGGKKKKKTYSNKHTTYSCTTQAQNSLPPNLLLKTWLQFQVAHNPCYTSPNTLVCTFKYRFTFLIISIYVMSTNESTYFIYNFYYRIIIHHMYKLYTSLLLPLPQALQPHCLKVLVFSTNSFYLTWSWMHFVWLCIFIIL